MRSDNGHIANDGSYKMTRVENRAEHPGLRPDPQGPARRRGREGLRAGVTDPVGNIPTQV
jgi:hypothetical protein